MEGAMRLAAEVAIPGGIEEREPSLHRRGEAIVSDLLDERAGFLQPSLRRLVRGRLFDEGEEIAPRRLFLPVQSAVIRKCDIGPQIAGAQRIRIDPPAEERFDTRCGTT